MSSNLIIYPINFIIMNYTKAKYYRQGLDLNKLIHGSHLCFMFQLKPINISNWFFLKKELSKLGFYLKICPLKLFKKTNLFYFQSTLIQNLHSGSILIIYSKKGVINMDRAVLKIFEENLYLVPLYVFDKDRFFFFDSFKELFLKSSPRTLIYTMSQVQSLIKVFIKVDK